MATADLSAQKLPFTTTVTMATANIAYPVTLPERACDLVIEFDKASKWSWTGTDGVILVGRHTAAANSTYQIKKGQGKATLYVQGDGVNTTLHLSCLGA
jgi:hypothetical protein